jgi:hypothetical protein
MKRNAIAAAHTKNQVTSYYKKNSTVAAPQQSKGQFIPFQLFNLHASLPTVVGYKITEPMRTTETALHTLGGFLDIGNDALFHHSQPWLKDVCTVMLASSVSHSSVNQSQTQNATQQPPAAP